MTKDFITIARNRRLNALAEIATRKKNGAVVTHIHTFPDLTNRHVDAVFRTRRTVQPAAAEIVAIAA